MNLYQITKEYQAAIDNLEIDENGEIINFNIDDIAGDLKAKRLAVAAYIKNLEVDYEALHVTILRLEKRMDFKNTKLISLKNYLKASLERTGEKEVKGLEFDIKIKTNPPKLIIDEYVLDSKFKIEKKTLAVDNSTIKDLILRGHEIMGAKLVKETRIEIK